MSKWKYHFLEGRNLRDEDVVNFLDMSDEDFQDTDEDENYEPCNMSEPSSTSSESEEEETETSNFHA